MAIGKKSRLEVEKNWDALTKEERVYSDRELKDFHEKIQKFREKKVLTTGEEINPLNWNKMAVAFGAYTVIEYQGKPYYRGAGKPDGECRRMYILDNLWKQYQDWCRRTDWLDQKKIDEYDKLAKEASLDELSTGVARQVSE